MNKSIFALLLAIPLLGQAALIKTVSVPVLDVWKIPTADTTTLKNDQRETQLLFGERVMVKKTQGPWSLIEAIEQMEFTHNNFWEGYPGWVLSSALVRGPENPIGQDFHVIGDLWVPITPEISLAFGSHFKGLSRDGAVYPRILPAVAMSTAMAVRDRDLKQYGYVGREGIVKAARFLLDVPYLWGGMSPAGLDCSGLVHLAYRVNNRRVPRDAHDQWLMAQKLTPKTLKVGDLIFSAAAQTPKKITHVVIYTDNEHIIEAPQTGMTVREISFQEKFGAALSEVTAGKPVGDRVIYFGSFWTP